MIYFDNAATSYPKPPEVRRAVESALSSFGANPGRGGHAMSLATSQEIYQCRLLLAEEMGLFEPEKVVFTHNCTTAVNMAMKGFLRRGDHVIISCLEHNAVARTVCRLSEQGVEYSIAGVLEGDTETTLRSFEALICPHTKLIVITHASNVFGITLPVREIARMAKGYGVLTLLDGAQTGGVLPIHMKEMDIAFLALAGHKGFYAPMGIGALLLNYDGALQSFYEGGTGSDSTNFRQPGILPDRFESGTPNVPGICGLRAGIEVVRARGRDKTLTHEIGLLQRFYDRLRDMKGITLYTARPEIGRCAPVLSFTVWGMESEQVARELDRCDIAVRAGLHCAPLAHASMGTLETGTVRIAPSFHNTAEEVDVFLNCLQKITEKANNTP